MKRRIGIVTVGRSDYGIYYPLLRAIQGDPACELCLIVGGAASFPRSMEIQSAKSNGMASPFRRGFPCSISDDSPEAISMSIGVGVVNFTSAYKTVRPDLLVLLGDPF